MLGDIRPIPVCYTTTPFYEAAIRQLLQKEPVSSKAAKFRFGDEGGVR